MASVLATAWRKVALPLIGAAGVGIATLLGLWLSYGAPGLAPALCALTLGIAGIRAWRFWPRPRVAVYWSRPGHRGGPYVLAEDAGRDAGPGDYASWTAILVGVAGLFANSLLVAFGAPGLPFEHSGSSFAGFFALLCTGLYWRP
ncbi:MAG: hypothetical protein AAF253_07460 [Pseudomonadota bacterium]